MAPNLQIYFLKITGILSLFFLFSCKPAVNDKNSNSIETEQGTQESPTDSMGILKPTLGNSGKKTILHLQQVRNLPVRLKNSCTKNILKTLIC